MFLRCCLLLLCFAAGQLQAAEVLRYHFDNSSADDSTGQNNHGTLSGDGCSYQADRNGQVLSLDKTSQCWLSMPANLIRSNPQFTLSMWFKTTSSGGLAGYSSSNVNQSSSQWVPILSVRNDGKLYAEMWIGSSLAVTSTDIVNDGQWHQAVLTSNNTSIRLYLDGVDIGGANGSPQHLSMNFNYIGTNDGRGRAQHPTGWNFFSGQIDDISFRTDALSAGDIAIPTYAVSYEANGASAGSPPAASNKLHDTAYTLASAGTLVKTNYRFSGWNTAADGSGTAYAAGDLYQTNAALTLYAQWQLALVNLSFDSAGGSAVATLSENIGTALTAPTPPTRTGYTFVNWEPAFPTSMPAADLVLTARWQLAQYQLSFDSNGGPAINPLMLNYTSPLQISVPTRTGHTFTGWVPTAPATMPAQALTLQAQWQVNQYQLSFNTAGGETLASRTVAYGTALSLPVPVRAGYAFSGWTTPAPTTMPAQDLQLTASWQPDSATITAKGGSSSVWGMLALGVLVWLRRSGKVLLLSLPCFAKAEQLYVGVQAGQAESHSSSELGTAVNRKMQQQGIAGTATELSNSDNSQRFFVGYRLNNWLSAELAWLDLGEAKLHYDNFVPQTERQLLAVQPQRGHGVEASLVAELVLESALRPYARVAIFHAQSRYLVNGPDQQQQFEQRSLRPGVELGAYYRFSPQWDLGMSLSHYQMENFATRQWQLGLRYHF